MNTNWIAKSLVAVGLVLAAPLASAQTVLNLPDVSQTTTITAAVSEQATITLPSSITFNVTNVGVSTTANAAFSVANIVTATALKQLRISVQANAASFTPPVAGAATWTASNVSWTAGSWTNATGSAGTLSNSAYTVVALGTANVGSLSAAAVSFTLASNASVIRSGNHTLVVTWKVESL